jgi:glycosyltransferase involved in cell wall biosynthesis
MRLNQASSTARRKIAIVVSTLMPGGAERVAVYLANNFAREGMSVDIVLVTAVGSLRDRLSPEVRVIDLRAGRAALAIIPLRRYARRERPDAILAVNFEINVAAALALAGLWRRPRLILSAHCAPSPYFDSAPTWWRKAMMLTSRLTYGKADWVVAVSHGVATDLTALRWASPDRLVTIHNPVLDDQFEMHSNQGAEHPWAHDSSIPLIVTTGRLTSQKNHSLLIRAFRRVLAQRSARLLILGEGEDRADLERLIENEGLTALVQLPGHVSNPYPLLRAASVFVLSSDYEGFGNALVEAMAVGTPVVSTDCPHGPREILEDGKWGKLVPPGNPDALASAILETLDRPGPSPQKRGLQFTVEVATAQYLDLVSIPWRKPWLAASRASSQTSAIQR